MRTKYIKIFTISALCASVLCQAQTLSPIKSKDELMREADQLTHQKKYEEAIKDYEILLSHYPDNVDFLWKLGNLYKSEGLNDNAIKAYKMALEHQPNNPDVNVSLAFVYLANHDQEASKELFLKALAHSPNYSDALAGLGRIAALQNNPKLAEQYFAKALDVDPNNNTALTYFGYFRMQQQNYAGAKTAFEKLLSEDPSNQDAREALKKIEDIKADEKDKTEAQKLIQERKYDDAASAYEKLHQTHPKKVEYIIELCKLYTKMKKPEAAENSYSLLSAIDKDNPDYEKATHELVLKSLLDSAKTYIDQWAYDEAVAIYLQLIDENPTDTDYYLLLGQLYARMDCLCNAIEILNDALLIQPNNTDLINALGFVYLRKATQGEVQKDDRFRFKPFFIYLFEANKCDLAISRCLFQSVLDQDPQNIEALAGLGRAATLFNEPVLAEYYLCEALAQNPDDNTALIYLAALKVKEKQYFAANEVYRHILALDPCNEDATDGLYDNYFFSEPLVSIGGFYTEENEKSNLLNEWIARLKTYGWQAAFTIPVNDCFRVSGAVVDERIDLKQLINHNNIYSLSVQRAAISGIWYNNPYLTTFASFEFSHYSQHLKANFRTKHSTLYEPSLGFAFSKGNHYLIAETTADATVVARNFDRNTAKLIQRQFLRGLYQYSFDTCWNMRTGAEGANIWYFDRLKNQEQRAAAWLEVSPVCRWKNLNVRYIFNYRNFNKRTVDYYSCQNQTTHWLQVQLFNSWRQDLIETSIAYARGWQRSFETGEIITITPVLPFHWINREIDIVTADIGIRFSKDLNFTVRGLYYHDSFDYTVGSIIGRLMYNF